MSGVRTFGYFDSFSPSGYYIFYAIYGYEFAEIRLVSMVDGKNFLE